MALRILWALIVIVAVILGGAFVFRPVEAPPPPDTQTNPPAVVEESEPSQREIETAFGKSVRALGVTITPLALVEDSRCARNVQCIWAGTVRVRADIASGMGTSTMTLELGQPITTEAETVTLIAVSPGPSAGTSIPPGDYRLTFRIEKMDILP